MLPVILPTTSPPGPFSLSSLLFFLRPQLKIGPSARTGEDLRVLLWSPERKRDSLDILGVYQQVPNESVEMAFLCSEKQAVSEPRSLCV